jgi:hypothetical protein
LRALRGHGGAFYGADFLMGFFLLRGWEGVDVVEDVGGFADGEGGAHFGEHVVLGEAWGLLALHGVGTADYVR